MADQSNGGNFMDSFYPTDSGVLAERVAKAQHMTEGVVKESDLLYAKTLTWHAAKQAIRVTVLILCVVLVVGALGAIPLVVKAWKTYVLGEGFSQKERMLDQTASRNVTRDDTGWPSGDSPAEKWAKAQHAVTKMPDTFRERMEEKTPEEKLMSQIAQ